VIEFGILALLFALMMFAIVEFGLLLNGWVSVSSTTREAARWAATGLRVSQWTDVLGTHDGIYEKVISGQSPPGVPSRDQTIVITYQSGASTWTCTAAPLGSGSFPQCNGPGGPYNTYDFPALASPPVPVGATVTVTLLADTYRVITPLVRPIFGCDGSVIDCKVPIKSWNAMYYEGAR